MHMRNPTNEHHVALGVGSRQRKTRRMAQANGKEVKGFQVATTPARFNADIHADEFSSQT